MTASPERPPEPAAPGSGADPAGSTRTAGRLDLLWAPWRGAYVSGDVPAPACIFCDALQAGDDASRLILRRSTRAFLMLNAYPYASGHLMVAPLRHAASLEELSDEEQLDLMRATQRALAALRAAYRPDGFNVGANLGRAAGAGVEGHLHLHVVPRWAGDTNFMPVVGSAKVLPETLDGTYRRLAPLLGA